MFGLRWNDFDPQYEVGVDRGVYYSPDDSGEAWSGLVSVIDNSDSDNLSRYVDGVRVGNRQRSGEFKATIESFSYPSAFDQRRRPIFGMSYRVMNEVGFKIHILYNVIAMPSSRNFAQSEAALFSWDVVGQPRSMPDAKPSAHLVVDAKKAYPWTVRALENVLYGSDTTDARLPSPEEVFSIFEMNSILQVTDNTDGSFTISGPDDAIIMVNETTIEINWPSVVQEDAIHYTISSL